MLFRPPLFFPAPAARGGPAARASGGGTSLPARERPDLPGGVECHRVLESGSCPPSVPCLPPRRTPLQRLRPGARARRAGPRIST